MIQPIMHDPLFLAQKSAPATPEDAPVARDLLDTLTAHADGCVGMAANMIGVLKRIIAVEAEDGYLVLFNPIILKKSGQLYALPVDTAPRALYYNKTMLKELGLEDPNELEEQGKWDINAFEEMAGKTCRYRANIKFKVLYVFEKWH